MDVTQAQLDHLKQHMDLFRAEKGDSVEEYFADHTRPDRDGLDLYIRVCDDLGLTPIGTSPEGTTMTDGGHCGGMQAPPVQYDHYNQPEPDAVTRAAEEAEKYQAAGAPTVQIDPAQLAAAMQAALGMDAGGPQSFEDALREVDPRDSDTALMMLDWLAQTGRLMRVGTLEGGQGYLYMYGEPKGTTKAGYRPGGTQGDRIVNEAVEHQRQHGVKRKTGVCSSCFSAVYQQEGDDTILLDDPDATNPAVCLATGAAHSLV